MTRLRPRRIYPDRYRPRYPDDFKPRRHQPLVPEVGTDPDNDTRPPPMRSVATLRRRKTSKNFGNSQSTTVDGLPHNSRRTNPLPTIAEVQTECQKQEQDQKQKKGSKQRDENENAKDTFRRNTAKAYNFGTRPDSGHDTTTFSHLEQVRLVLEIIRHSVLIRRVKLRKFYRLHQNKLQRDWIYLPLEDLAVDLAEFHASATKGLRIINQVQTPRHGRGTSSYRD